MAHYKHGWINTLAGMLDMEEEHCRENLRHYASGPDHDTYAAFLADVLELRKRLRSYDAAPELLAALKELVHYDMGNSEHGSYGSEVLGRCKSAIAKAEGRDK